MAEEPPSTMRPPPLSPGKDPLAIYLGISFWVYLGLLPRASVAYTQSLHTRVRSLAMQLFHAEEQIRQMRSRRKEDSKANARVVEIFASHRNEWQEEERRLMERIEAGGEEIWRLKERVAELEEEEEELRREVERLRREREEMVVKVEEAEGDEAEELVEKKVEMGGGGGCDKYGKDLVENVSGGGGGDGEEYSGVGMCGFSDGGGMGVMRTIPEVSHMERGGLEEMMAVYNRQNGLGRDYYSSVSKCWDTAGWQDVQYSNLPVARYPVQHFVPRRESPWKVDCDSTGVQNKLKFLEQELVNLEKLGNEGLSKVSALMRKQAKRYQSLSAKIYDLCKRLQVDDPSDPTLSPEFRTQRQTDFLLEAFRLQQRASETRQKLTSLQLEAAGSCVGDRLTKESKANTKKSLESIRNNFKEIQRNLEILLARIMGDLEGILAREGTSHASDHYISRYPFAS